MRKGWYVWCLVVVFGVMCSAAQRGAETPSTGEQFLGIWSGSWAAEGSGGGFELTLEKGKDGAVTGKVAVTGEPTYNAAFKALSFDEKKMNARYDFPPNEAGEVVLAATFEGNTAKGTWALRAKGSDKDEATGTWTVTKR
jgi:hypothetical protein